MRPSCTIRTGATFPCFAPDPPYRNDDRAIEYYAEPDEGHGRVRHQAHGQDTRHGAAQGGRRGNQPRATSCGWSTTRSGARYPLRTATFFRCPCSSRSTRSTPAIREEALVPGHGGRRRAAGPGEQAGGAGTEDPRLLVRHPAVLLREIVSWLEQEWKAVIAMDMVSYCPYELVDTSSEDSIFRGLAKRAFQDGPMVHQGRGLADNVVHDITRIVKDYSIDCVIFPGHMGHKDMAASASLMREVCRDFEVPFPAHRTGRRGPALHHAWRRSRTGSPSSSPRWCFEPSEVRREKPGEPRRQARHAPACRARSEA